jgi:acyl-CoA thioesterase
MGPLRRYCLSMDQDHSPGAPDPLGRLLGFEVLEQGAGRCSLRAAVGPEHVNQHATAHGGFMFALADSAFGLAANSHGPVAVALVATIHFTRAVWPGDVLVAEAREVALGRSAATYEVTVSVDGATVALFTGTVHRRPERRAGP